MKKNIIIRMFLVLHGLVLIGNVSVCMEPNTPSEPTEPQMCITIDYYNTLELVNALFPLIDYGNIEESTPLSSELYICKTCHASFNDNESLMSHYFSVLQSRKITKLKMASDCFKKIPFLDNKCRVCDSDMQGMHPQSQERSHIIHKHVQPFKCEYCTKSEFQSLSRLLAHQKREHEGEFELQRDHGNQVSQKMDEYQCATCAKIFESNDSLMDHYFPHYNPNNNVASHHTSNCFQKIVHAANTCRLCHKILIPKNEMSHINQVHIKPFICFYCAHKSGNQKDLIIHHRNKHPSKQYRLNLNIRPHTSPPYTIKKVKSLTINTLSCSECSQQFNSRSALNKHECAS